MILRGILDNSLSGQLCIRGFAHIKDLASISKADYTYQRNPIEGREDIVDFLDKENYLFFPEIILGYKFRHTFTGKKIDFPLQTIQSSTKYTSPVDHVKASIKTQKFSGITDSRNSDTVKIIELEIPASVIEEKLFHRIDGNHRLKAAEESESSKVDSMVAPFCIILGQEIYQEGQLQQDENLDLFNKSIKVFFHNINTKTIPLKSEENLKVLLDDTAYFPDEELEHILGKEGILARKLYTLAEPKYFTNISHILTNHYRTYYLEIFSKLVDDNKLEDDVLVNNVFESLKSIDQLYKENSTLKSNTSLGLLTAFLYYHIQGEVLKFERFVNWVMANHIYEIDEIKAESIIKIFDKIAQQEIKIFVAMPYFDGDADVVSEYNTIYDTAIKKISKKHGVAISLFPIMQNKGETEDQIQDIINKIKECTIFFSDISDNNANVLYETGWARALNKHVILVREKDSQKPKSDYSNDTYHTYKNSARTKTLSKIIEDNIMEIMTSNYGLIINE
ncbi:hypothetical protein DBR39_06815 [Chryseobacterium sp. KBW03]|uniref:hypothetical protein n=1 Tax=Chryseobacterium sp. KBW03 TaxID=2153362 RepID=UPI000F5939F2|nr:hypothetical protein [Chryseobacterium sp. KBW03]RQO40646.1 hypothetical protein DBR39_06815 [Chryseobacterium sp. KBW03]